MDMQVMGGVSKISPIFAQNRPIHVSPPRIQYKTTYWNFEGKNSGYSVWRDVQRMARMARTDIRTEMLVAIAISTRVTFNI